MHEELEYLNFLPQIINLYSGLVQVWFSSSIHSSNVGEKAFNGDTGCILLCQEHVSNQTLSMASCNKYLIVRCEEGHSSHYWWTSNIRYPAVTSVSSRILYPRACMFQFSVTGNILTGLWFVCEGMLSCGYPGAPSRCYFSCGTPCAEKGNKKTGCAPQFTMILVNKITLRADSWSVGSLTSFFLESFALR